MTWPTWDPANSGSDVTFSADHLTVDILAFQEWTRCTLGRDPSADATPRQWEDTVAGTHGGGQGDNMRPASGMVDEDRVTGGTGGIAWIGDTHGWLAGMGANGFENDYTQHNGPLGVNWTGGSNGGFPWVIGKVWYPQAVVDGVGSHNAGDLDFYLNGVKKYTLAGVTSGPGKLMYPMFGTGSNYAVGVNGMLERAVTNFGATALSYPVSGAVVWGLAAAPVAAFSCTPQSGVAPLAVVFTNSSTGADSSLWDFGDGTTSTSTSPTHAYTMPGVYNVTLTVTNTAGSDTKTVYGAVVVADDELVETVSVSPDTGIVGAMDANLDRAWITSSGSVVIVPGKNGGLATLNTSGTVLDRLEGALSRVAFALAAGGYIYCFDGLGGGAVVAVDGTTGIMTPTRLFDATDCQGVLDGFISGSSLIVAALQQAAIITFSIATAGDPAAPSRSTSPGDLLNGVLNDASSTPLTDEVQASLALPVWFPALGGATLTGPVNVIAAGRNARVQVK